MHHILPTSLWYITSISPPMTTQTIDDQDGSHVTYVGNWVHGGMPNKEYAGTVASSTRVNDSFIVAFKGILISVYGTVDSTSGGVISSYALDGAAAAEATSRAGPGDTYNQLFWTSPGLVSAGDHQLVVKMVKVNYNAADPGKGTIWFDYFTVAGAPSPPKKKNVGAIVGGVVGGISVLILLVLLFHFYCRRRLSKDIPVDPFPAHSDHVLPGTKEPTMTSTDQPSIMPISPNSKRGPNGFMATPASPPPVEEAAGSGSLHVTPSSPLSPEEPLQHSDSGLRDVDPVSILPSGRTELPPVYSSL